MPRRRITRRERNPNGQSKFNRTRQSIIVEGITSGLPISRAVDLAGIEYATYRKWMIKGRDTDSRPHQRFRDRVKKALVERERHALNTIRECGLGGQEVRETKVIRGPRGKEVTKITKKTPADWRALVRWLQLVSREAYGDNAEYSLHEEKPQVPQSKVSVEADVSAEVNAEVNQKQTIVEALRSLDTKDVEHFANILRKIDTATSTPESA
jgi:hypothetical protein